MVGSAFALYALAFDVAAARRKLRVDPVSLAAAGLAVACLSGVPALLYGEPFLTGIWREVPLLFGVVFDLGTPLIFDVGVYLVVWGILLTLVFALGEEA
jgi:multicomponent Na+:H+ antiporter subunit B